RSGIAKLTEATRGRPEVYRRIGARRVGRLQGASYRWATWEGVFSDRPPAPVRVAVYHGEDGVEGFAAYQVSNPWPEDGDAVLHVTDLMVGDRKSTRLNSSHVKISYAVFCLKKKKMYARK